MQLTIQTPALLFPAISFLMLAYTNRYSALTRLARDLLRDYDATQAGHVIVQIGLVRQRIRIIRIMLTLAAISIGASSFTILALYEEWETVGKVVFTVSLIMLTVTYALAVFEISVSSRALDIQIDATLGQRP